MEQNGLYEDHDDLRNVEVKFVVAYETKWGESVVVTGSRGLLGAGDVERAVRMKCTHGCHGLLWEACVTVPPHYECEYHYVIIDEQSGAVIRRESAPHQLHVEAWASGSCIMLSDHFQTLSDAENIYKTSAFRNAIFRDKEQVQNPLPQWQQAGAGLITVRFSIKDCTLQPGHAVFVYGGIEELGNWQERHAVQLQEVDTPRWECDLTLPCTSFPFTYRYFISDCSDAEHSEGGFQEEAGEARLSLLEPQPMPDDSSAAHPNVSGAHSRVAGDLSERMLDDAHRGSMAFGTACGRAAATRIDLMHARQWPSFVRQNDGHFRHRIQWRGSGLAMPVFSMRTHSSVGCGDFQDIKAMVDFVATTGMRVLQVLPVNDTSVYGMWWDSYPYSSISVFALHPMYLSLPMLVKGKPSPEVTALIDTARTASTACLDVDYEATVSAKLSAARSIFDGAQGARELEDSAFQTWRDANVGWLAPYATFCFLKELMGTADHRDWGALHRDAASHVARISDPSQPFHSRILFTYWLQWHLHLQLLDAAEYARSKHVVLKGDLPIGVAKASADTWVNPELFHMDVSVGSPPDAFDPKGQNWGFPGYNWEQMAKDGYQWWRQRLSHMAQYFTAYRVDHVLGFFRVYEVPERHVTGALGHFRPSRPLWRSGLENVGLWDIDRLCEPWITEEILREHAADDFDEVVGRFMERCGQHRFRLRSEWFDERAIAGLSCPDDSPDWLQEKTGNMRAALMRLRGNVILLRDEHHPDKFYPRFELFNTSSFHAFDESKHTVLRELHDGYFYKNHDVLWADCARRTLPALMQSTDMLICGEDLGFVPGCVPPVMHELGIIGLRIQRMPGMESPEGAEFGDPALYSYWTVASPSCHDTSTTRAWYNEDAARRERFYYSCLEGTGETPPECTPSIMQQVAQQHLASPAIFCILPLQDWLSLLPQYYTRSAEEETINDPTNPRHYWRWRMQPCVEDLLADHELIALIQNLNQGSGRASEAALRRCR